MTQYLRQRGSGHIYIRTDILAKRNDMQPYDPELADLRIDSLKRRLESLNKDKEERDHDKDSEFAKAMEQAQQKSKALAELEEAIERAERRRMEDFDTTQKADKGDDIKTENKIEAEFETKMRERDRIITNDPHIKKLTAMRKIAEVEGYLLENYAHEITEKMNLQQIKNLAIQMRTDQLFELEDD